MVFDQLSLVVSIVFGDVLFILLTCFSLSADVSFEEKVIQNSYEKLLDDLDVKSSVNLFYGRGLITFNLKERICSAVTTEDANEVLVDDLIKGISLTRFSKFVSLLRESADKYKRPHHKTLADKLEGDLKVSN